MIHLAKKIILEKVGRLNMRMNEELKRYREEEEKRAKELDKIALNKFKKEGKEVGIESKINKEASIRFREWLHR